MNSFGMFLHPGACATNDKEISEHRLEPCVAHLEHTALDS